MRNLRQLHIIRGIAALYVAIGHCKIVFWVGGQEYIKKFPRADWGLADYFLFTADVLSSAGHEFVIVFFVLSGFFINYSFDKNNWTTKGFYLNRLIRIYPPYILSVIFSIFVFLAIRYFNEDVFSSEIPRAINSRMANSNAENVNWTSFLKSLVFFPHKDYVASNFSYWSL